jgi:hypothetical protein
MGCFVQHSSTTVYYNEKSTTTNCEDIPESRCIQIQASDCKGTLICHDRGDSGLGKEGYNVDRVSPTFRFCVEEETTKIGCDPLLETNPSIWARLHTTNRASLCSLLRLPTDPTNCDNSYTIGNRIVSTNGYWDGTTFATARIGYYVPYTKDGNGDLVIHQQDFPCPAGRYGVDAFYDEYTNARMCAFCRHSKYQDEEGQTSCKSCPSGKQHIAVGQTSAAACINCPSGKVLSTEYQNPMDGFCENCDMGKYASGGSCTNCPSGRWGGGGEYDSCKNCAGGRYSNAGSAYSSNCKLCSTGEVNPLISDGNAPVSGYTLVTSGVPTGLVSSSHCESYATHKSHTWGGTVTDYGYPGGCFVFLGTVRYNSRFNLNNCDTFMQCIENPVTYNDGTCTICAAGKYRYSSDRNCHQCQAGRYSYEGTQYSQGDTKCSKCACGRYNTVGQARYWYSFGAACTGCGSGKFQPNQGMSYCADCPSGKFNCNGCSSGWYRI